MRTTDERIRVLHVVNRLDRGGVETWLVHLLRNIDRSRFTFDFIVHSTEPGAYDDEVRAMGANIYPCLYPSQPAAYAWKFRHIIRAHGPFGVVHSHVQHFGGVVMGLAATSGVPIRIAHSHLDSSPLEKEASWKRRAYLASMRTLIHRCATVRIAASSLAGDSLFHPGWNDQLNNGVLYCGVDPTPFDIQVDKERLRQELGIPPEAFVIGQIANFRTQKNHSFTVGIASEFANRRLCVRFLLVGEGPERKVIETEVIKSGLEEYVIFAGDRADVPRLMIGAMDCSILPSLSEGLPLTGIESQLAGLPLILSDRVTNEIVVVPQLVQHLPIASPVVWADALTLLRKMPIKRSEAFTQVSASQFHISFGTDRLENIYARS